MRLLPVPSPPPAGSVATAAGRNSPQGPPPRRQGPCALQREAPRRQTSARRQGGERDVLSLLSPLSAGAAATAAASNGLQAPLPRWGGPCAPRRRESHGHPPPARRHFALRSLLVGRRAVATRRLLHQTPQQLQLGRTHKPVRRRGSGDLAQPRHGRKRAPNARKSRLGPEPTGRKFRRPRRCAPYRRQWSDAGAKRLGAWPGKVNLMGDRQRGRKPMSGG